MKKRSAEKIIFRRSVKLESRPITAWNILQKSKKHERRYITKAESEMIGIKKDNIVKKTIGKQVKRNLRTIARAQSRILNKRKEVQNFKFFDLPKCSQILKRHEGQSAIEVSFT